MMTMKEMTDTAVPSEVMIDTAVPDEATTDMSVPDEVTTDMLVPDEVITDMAVQKELSGAGPAVVLTCAPLALGTEEITVQIMTAVHVMPDTIVLVREHHMVGAEALSMPVMTEAGALAMVVTS